MPPRGHDDHEPQMLSPPMITPSHTRLQAQRSVVSLDPTSPIPAMESTGRTVGERSPMGLSDVVELPGSGCMAIILCFRPITTVRGPLVKAPRRSQVGRRALPASLRELRGSSLRAHGSSVAEEAFGQQKRGRIGNDDKYLLDLNGW